MVEPLEDGLSLVAAAVANAPDAISVFREGAKGRLELVYVNRAFERDTGWTRDEAQAHGAEFFTPSLAKRLIAGETLRRETSLPRKSGDPYPVTVTAWPTSLSNGERYFILLAGDPDEGRRMAQRLAAHSERLRQLHVVALSSGRTAERQIDAFLEFGTQVFGLDIAFAGPIADGKFTSEHSTGTDTAPKRGQIQIGEQWPVEQLGLQYVIDRNDVFAAADFATSEIMQDIDAEQPPPYHAYIAAPMTVRGRQHGAIVFAGFQPRERPFDADEREVMRLLSALIGSAIERGEDEHRLDTLAFYDSLTGLPNRVLLEDRLQQALARAKRHKQAFAVHALDLDHFKEVNDRGGHPEGDAALQTVSRRFSAVLRETDTLARVGGDEFVALQSHITNDKEAGRLAERFIAAMVDPVIIGPNSWQLGVSIGVALFDRDGDDAHELLRNADRALYVAKNMGRGCFEFAMSKL